MQKVSVRRGKSVRSRTRGREPQAPAPSPKHREERHAPFSGISSLNAARVALALVLVLALGMLYRSAWSAGNLDIVPDSVEYAVAAQRFAATGHYDIAINHRVYPPRYPPAFSVLVLAPIYALFPGDPGNGIYAVLLLSIVALVLAWSVGRRVSGTWGGVLAALAVLALPDFREMSRQIMSDVPALAIGLAALVLYLRMFRGATVRDCAAAGLLVTLAAAIREEYLALLLPFVVLAARRDRGLAARLAALLAPAAALIAATAVHNAHTFGSWDRTGYSFWCAVPYDYLSLTFSPRYAPKNLAVLLSAKALPAIVAGALGLGLLRRRRSAELPGIARFLLLATGPIVLVHLFYFAAEVRFFLLPTAVLAIGAGAAAGALIPGRFERLALVAPMVLLPFLNFGLMPRDPAPMCRIVARALARATPRNAVIVTGLDAVFLDEPVIEGTDREIVPTGRNIEYAGKLVTPRRVDRPEPPPRGPLDHRCPGLLRGGAIDLFPFTAAENPERLVAMIRQGRPVYLDTLFGPLRLRKPGENFDRFVYEPVPGYPGVVRLQLPAPG